MQGGTSTALERIAASLSHDVREPIRTIRGFLDLFEARCGDALSGDKREFLDFVKDAAVRLEKHVSALAAYARIGREGVRETFDLSEALDAAVAATAGELADAGGAIDLAPGLDGGALRVEGDRGLLQHLFEQLVRRAIRTRPDGRPPRLRVETPGPGIVRVTCRNGGPVDPESPDPFALFRDAPAGSPDAARLELATCHRIAEWHGGRIAVGPGARPDETVFRLELPHAAVPVA